MGQGASQLSSGASPRATLAKKVTFKGDSDAGSARSGAEDPAQWGWVKAARATASKGGKPKREQNMI